MQTPAGATQSVPQGTMPAHDSGMGQPNHGGWSPVQPYETQTTQDRFNWSVTQAQTLRVLPQQKEKNPHQVKVPCKQRKPGEGTASLQRAPISSMSYTDGVGMEK